MKRTRDMVSIVAVMTGVLAVLSCSGRESTSGRLSNRDIVRIAAEFAEEKREDGVLQDDPALTFARRFRDKLNMLLRPDADSSHPPSWGDAEVSRNVVRMVRDYLSSRFRHKVIGDETTGFQDCVAIGWDRGDHFEVSATGTIVAPRKILTCGHNLRKNAPTHIMIGYDASRPKATGAEIIPLSGDPVFPSDFDESTFTSDLAILTVSKPIAGITPRPLATDEQLNDPEVFHYVVVVGFGRNTTSGTTGEGRKREASVPIRRALCTLPVDVGLRCKANKEFVTGTTANDADSCTGDSGGPAYLMVGDDVLLAGVVSRRVNDASRICGDGGIYVRVDKYRNWINDQLAP